MIDIDGIRADIRAHEDECDAANARDCAVCDGGTARMLLAEVERLNADLKKYDDFAGGMKLTKRAPGGRTAVITTVREHLGITVQ